MTILDELSDYARIRVKEKNKTVPFEKIKEQALALPRMNFEFEKALSRPGLSLICECKQASPSKGQIAESGFPYLDIAREYAGAGADAISVLTEPKWFRGSDDYLREIADAVSVPCIRKDFTVDEYMIYEARLLGASAVLLICSILPEETICEYIGVCDSLGLSALVEAHDADEVDMALRAGARVVGVNNRNLKDFTVDIMNSVRLRERVPQEITFVSESGIMRPEDVKVLKENGTDAVLIGEMMMRADDKASLIKELKEI